MRFRNAFTLVELLVVLGIIAILAAILFPVFLQARRAGAQTTCTANFQAHGAAILLYVNDYDESMPLTWSGDGTYNAPPGQVLYQLLQPYLKSLQVYDCPADPASDTERATLYMPLPKTAEQYTLNVGVRDNFGFNYQYLCPFGTRPDGYMVSAPIKLSMIGDSSKTIEGVDSLWAADVNGENPWGGGNGSVDPPCRYYSANQDSFSPMDSSVDPWGWGGWNPTNPLYGDNYGYVWFWHGRKATVAFCDGHVKPLTKDQLTDGCIVHDNWGGYIIDREKYLWDLQ